MIKEELQKNEINIEDIEKEKIEILQLIEGKKVVTKNIKKELLALGYEELCLGTGKQSVSYSKQINIWNLNNSYLKGVYFGVGVASMQCGKGNRYYAIVKKVKE